MKKNVIVFFLVAVLILPSCTALFGVRNVLVSSVEDIFTTETGYGEYRAAELLDLLVDEHLNGSSFTRERLMACAQREFIRAINTDRSVPAQEAKRLSKLAGRTTFSEISDFGNFIRRNLPAQSNKSVRRMFNYVMQGLVIGTGDPYTRYFDQRTGKIMSSAARRFGAGGPYGFSVVNREDGSLVVASVYRGYDAFYKGLRSGDVISEIGPYDASSMPKHVFVNEHCLTPPKYRFGMRIERPGRGESFIVYVDGRRRVGRNVEYGMLPGGVGYVALGMFCEGSEDDVQEALVELELRGMKGLVFDVRNNPGGGEHVAAAIAGMFLEKDAVIARVSHRDARLPIVWRARRGYKYDGPLVVLVNGSSASASELFAGSMISNKRARLVGEKTWGKYWGQISCPLNTTLGETTSITVMKYWFDGFTPQPGGIVPDVHVRPADVLPWTPGRIATSLLPFMKALYNGAGPEVRVLVATGDDWEELARRKLIRFQYAATLLPFALPLPDVKRAVRKYFNYRLRRDGKLPFIPPTGDDPQLAAARREIIRITGEMKNRNGS